MVPLGARGQLGAGAAVGTIAGALATKCLRPLTAWRTRAARAAILARWTFLASPAAGAITTEWLVLARRPVIAGRTIGTRRPLPAVGTIFPGRALVPGMTAFTRTTFFAGRAAGGMRSATWGTITTGAALVTRTVFLSGTAILAGTAFHAGTAFLTRAAIIAARTLALERAVFPVGALRP